MKLITKTSLIIGFLLLQLLLSLEGKKLTRKKHTSRFHSKKGIISSISDSRRTNWFSNMPFRIELGNPKWMSTLDDNALLSRISIPGTHDSGSLEFPNQYSWVKPMAITQVWTIYEQLMAGVRYLDIRLGSDGNIYHSSYKTSIDFNHVLTNVKNFLTNNPSEAIIMRVKNENTLSGGNTSIKFVNMVVQYSDMFLFQNTIPTLREVRGKVFPILEEIFYQNVLYWNNSLLIRLQDDFQLTLFFSKNDKKKSIKTFHNANINNNGNYFAFNHCSANGSLSGDTNQSVAFTTNKAILEVEGSTGIVIFDYPSEELIKNIIDRNVNMNLNQSNSNVNVSQIPAKKRRHH